MTSQSLLTAEMMAVSLMGEQWSPQTAPAKTEPIVAMRTGEASVSGVRPVQRTATVTTSGMSTAIVRQDVPVLKETRQARTNTSNGKRPTGHCGSSNDTKY